MSRTSVATALQMMDSGECYGADGQGPRHGKQEKSWLLYGKAQQVGCLQGLISPLGWDAGIQSHCTAHSGVNMVGWWVWALQHHTGVQCSVMEWTSARVAVRRVLAPAPQPEPTGHLRSALHAVSFLCSASKCQ